MSSDAKETALNEEWRPIPGYEGLYEVSSHGRFYAHKRSGVHRGRWGMMEMNFPAKMLTLSTTPTGYHYLALTKPGEKHTKILAHRLVALAFHGPAPEGMQVNHLDGDKSNNRPENLEYCTCQQNLRHCIDVLGKKRGEGAGNAKLREADIRPIREDSRSLREIAKDYGVTLQAISHVKKRKNWGHVL